MLCKQHFINNTQLLFLSTVAYIGIIFIVLSIVQLSNRFQPHDLDSFQGFLVGFVAVFGILYAGHSFPAFRSKESTMTYLMVPASLPEKFVFEFFSRIVTTLLALPLLYWTTFHLQGYFFTIFTSQTFESVGLQYLIKINVPENDHLFWIYTVVSTAVLLAFVLVFTGSAMFTKQPLMKSLFALAVIMIFYSGYSYIVIEHLGVGKYNPPDAMWLVPMSESGAFRFFSAALILAIGIMMFVSYRKLKEKEV